jgi:hypothetical protein
LIKPKLLKKDPICFFGIFEKVITDELGQRTCQKSEQLVVVCMLQSYFFYKNSSLIAANFRA